MRKAKFDLEKLITLVEKHECLWNPFLKTYRSKNVRYLAWQKIATILEQDMPTIHKRWRVMRDRYKRELNGTYPKKDNKPWEYAKQMSFLDKIYVDTQFGKEVFSNNQPVIQTYKSQPIIQPFTSQPIIITVPNNCPPSFSNLRPIAPKIVKEDIPTSVSIKAPNPVAEVHSNSFSGNESEEQISKEPEIYLVTPTLFNEQERTLFKNSLSIPAKRKANDVEYSDDESVEDDDNSRTAVTEDDNKVDGHETRGRLQWEEREHLLRMQFLEEEHQIKMQIEQTRLKVETENLKIKEQKLKVLIAKENYFKGLLEAKISEDD